eukprot:scaffold118277_cov29-Tisochrysis_lutea.AAC.1
MLAETSSTRSSSAGSGSGGAAGSDGQHGPYGNWRARTMRPRVGRRRACRQTRLEAGDHETFLRRLVRGVLLWRLLGRASHVLQHLFHGRAQGRERSGSVASAPTTLGSNPMVIRCKVLYVDSRPCVISIKHSPGAARPSPR